MEDNPADELNIKMAHGKGALASLPHYRKGLGQNLIKDASAKPAEVLSCLFQLRMELILFFFPPLFCVSFLQALKILFILHDGLEIAGAKLIRPDPQFIVR